MSLAGTWLTSAGSAADVRWWGIAEIRAQVRAFARDGVAPKRPWLADVRRCLLQNKAHKHAGTERQQSDKYTAAKNRN